MLRAIPLTTLPCDPFGRSPRSCFPPNERIEIHSEDLTTGNRALVPGAVNDLVYPADYVSAFAIDAVHQEALFLSIDLRAVDLESGEVRVVAGSPSGVDLSGGSGLAMDGDRSRVLATDRYRHLVLGFDLGTWKPSQVSDDSFGSGPLLGLGPLVFDPERRLVFVGDGLGGALYSMDPETGERRTVALGMTGTSWIVRSALDAARDRILGVAGDSPWLSAIQLSSGVREIVSDEAHGSGPSLAFSRALAFDAHAGRALVGTCNGTERGLFWVDVNSGDRALLSDGAPLGSRPGCPVDIALDPARGRAIVLNKDPGFLVAVDSATGTASTIHDFSADTAWSETNPVSMAVDASRGRAIVELDDPARPLEHTRLVSIDLETGALITISEPASQHGFRIWGPLAPGDPDTQTTWAIGPGVLAVDNETGDRVIVSR